MSFQVIAHDKRTQTAIIANGATTSGVIDLRNVMQATYQIPAAFTGATVSFTVSNAGGTFVALQTIASTPAAVAQGVAASGQYPFPDDVLKFNFCKIVSASAEAAARSILVFTKA